MTAFSAGLKAAWDYKAPKPPRLAPTPDHPTPGVPLAPGRHHNRKGITTMARTTIYQGRALPLADAQAAYAAIDALQAQVWEELVTVRDMAQSVLSRINEAKARALADVVASQKAELEAK